MQTKQQLQQLLASAGRMPDSQLGQNFLIDLNLMRLLIESAKITGNDLVLEVGCGMGSLTDGLAEKAGKVITVEFDKELATIAETELAEYQNIELIRSDVLENKHTINRAVTEAIESVERKADGRFLLVANLPYNVATPVMLNLIRGPVIADAMYVTVQKEVAERMAAKSGSKQYGVLSIFMAAAGDVEIIRILKPTVFWPQPQVDSAMVSFVRNEEKIRRIKNMELFAEVINLFMGHRRKMLRACTKFAHDMLAGIDNWSEIFEKCSINPKNRPEQISPNDYVAVANLCCEYLGMK